ncbi:MAG: DUF4388 domain-containing protein [Trueperaceae bacterium]|nr:DUF4388 domain-containing protein [Trueperaceae bacterium]
MIEGNLRHLPLSEVFQIIVTGQKSGVLSLKQNQKRSRIFFEMGRVQYAYCVPGLHLAEILVRTELLSSFEVQKLYEALEDKHSNLASYANEQGLITEDSLKLVLKTYITETLTFLLSWRSGNFFFTEKSALTTQTPPEYTFEAMSLLMEVIRRHDEWGRGLAEPKSIYQQVGNPTTHTLPEGSWDILGLIDGRRSSSSIAAELDMPEEDVYRILYVLAEEGILSKHPFLANEPLILVVSKNIFYQRLIRFMLRRIAVQPWLEDDYAKALETAAQDRPKVIIVEKQDESTWDFVKELRQIPGFSQIPILMLDHENESVGILKRWNRPKVIKILKPFQEIALQQLVSQFVGRASV